MRSKGKIVARYATGKFQWVASTGEKKSISWRTTVLNNLLDQKSDGENLTVKDLVDRLEKGLDREAFDRLTDFIGITPKMFSDNLGIPFRTLNRRKDVFKPEESQKIFRVASVFHKAFQLFEDLEKARSWFLKPKKALFGETPLEFCKTDLGAREVEDFIGKLEHGVYV